MAVPAKPSIFPFAFHGVWRSFCGDGEQGRNCADGDGAGLLNGIAVLILSGVSFESALMTLLVELSPERGSTRSRDPEVCPLHGVYRFSSLSPPLSLARALIEKEEKQQRKLSP